MVDGLETGQRGLEGQEIVDRHRPCDARFHEIVQRHRLNAAAPLVAFLMAAMIDDDPASSNNQSGQFGIEIEATTKVSVRSLWVKALR